MFKTRMFGVLAVHLATFFLLAIVPFRLWMGEMPWHTLMKQFTGRPPIAIRVEGRLVDWRQMPNLHRTDLGIVLIVPGQQNAGLKYVTTYDELYYGTGLLAPTDSARVTVYYDPVYRRFVRPTIKPTDYAIRSTFDQTEEGLRWLEARGLDEQGKPKPR